MAKRRRLTPASPNYLGPDAGSAAAPQQAPELGPERGPERAPEVKSAFAPPTAPRPPIAQVAGDTSAAAALGELSEMVTRARAEGRLVQALALAEIDAGHLVRDRLLTEEDELQTLIASLRARGQQMPIEVVDRGAAAHPRYGLISGWRRLTALRRLASEDPRFGSVLALVRTPRSASEAYVAMIEENEIRVGLSFFERARIVVKALEQGVHDDARTALQTLFANVPRAKRSKIKSFMTIVEALDGALAYPTAIGERLGLTLARALETDASLAPRLRTLLGAAPCASPAEELERLAQALEAAPAPAPALQPEPGLKSESTLPESTLAPRPPAVPVASRTPLRPVPPPAPRPEVEARYDATTGTITLSGTAVTPALCAALERWLRQSAP